MFLIKQKAETLEQYAVRKVFNIGFLKLRYTAMLFLIFQL